jgi:hypothetical protein
MVGMTAGGESGWVQWLGDDRGPPDFLEKTEVLFGESVDW